MLKIQDLILEIYDFNFQSLGALVNVSSLQWIEAFYETGNFTVWLNVSELSSVDFIRKDNLIWIYEDVAGIIEKVNRVSSDSSAKIIIKGRMIKSFLAFRSILAEVNLTSKRTQFILDMVNNNFINSEDKRKLPNLTIKENQEIFGEDVAIEHRPDSCLWVTEELLKTESLGYNISFRPREKKYVFEIIKPTDRSINQDLLPKVLFSSKEDNIKNSDFYEDSENHENVIYVNSSNLSQTFEFSNGDFTGFNRREGIVSDSSESEEIARSTADERLESSKVVTNLSGEIIQDSSQYIFKEDFFLGDIVSIEDYFLGIVQDVVVEKITFNVDANGLTVNPIFGTPIKSVKDEISKLERK